MNHARRQALLLAPAALLWTAGVLAPVLLLLRLSLYWRGPEGEHKFDVFYYPGTWTLQNYAWIFTDSFYLRTLLFTLGLGILVTAITVTLGYILAYAIYRASGPGKALLIVLIALPKFTSIIVFVYGLKILVGPNGLWPVVAGEVLMLLPYAALTIAAALQAVSPRLVEAAHGLGAGAWAAFWNVTFRASLPGAIAATLLVFLWSLGAFLSPYLLGGPNQYTLAVQVDRQTYFDLNWPLAAALNITLLILVAAIGYTATRVRARLV
jgi:spermidine/putrescine transport system permease protein